MAARVEWVFVLCSAVCFAFCVCFACFLSLAFVSQPRRRPAHPAPSPPILIFYAVLNSPFPYTHPPQSLGNARRIMYAPSQNVHNPHHNIPPPQQQPHRNPPNNIPKDPVNVVGIPSVSIQNNRLVVGSSQSSSPRSYTLLKVLGDGSFGTVWLCDWHGTLPPNTPLSPMQCGAGARPDWVGKRLVAVKRMKKKWEGGWDECQKLKELESLRAIPFHPNIIPLYDFFLLPDSKELYFVFESMEGNLYHLIKARKGRAFAGGLVSSIFRQIVSGLDHIHASGYFHRDMKPENVLVTTTGLFDYTSVSPIAPPNAPKEKDVVAIIKLADFGLARETISRPPYTEYVSTRWYRAPEVLLLSRNYSNPVDMWALGTIMAELVNLRPLFPGSDQVDQVARICEILGDPCDDYGIDAHGSPVGGGPWSKGIKLAEAVGFQFPKIEPKDIYSLFERTVPVSLIHCIRDLLRYDPDKRLTSRQCLEHQYLLETTHRNNIPLAPGLRVATSHPPPQLTNGHSSHTLSSLSPRSVPPSHSHSHSSFPDPSSNHRSPYQYATAPTQYGSIGQDGRYTQPPAANVWGDANGHHPHAQQVDYPMDISPQQEHPDHFLNGHAADVHGSPMVQEYPERPHIPQGSIQDPMNGHVGLPQPSNKLGKLSSIGKKSSKWGFGMFGGDKHQVLPPVDENAASSTPSLKRTQSSSTDASGQDASPIQENHARSVGDLKKLNKKEAERLQREAEKQRRQLKEKMNREQARAVMQKRNQVLQKTAVDDIEWVGGSEQRVGFTEKGKQAESGPIRYPNQSNGGNHPPSATVQAAAGKFGEATDWRMGTERFAKARRREYDDDHSMSSSEVHSIGRMSSISFATVDSDPGPSRIRNRPSLFGISRMTSMSSLRTSFDDFPASARSSNSFSLEGQLANDFRTQASVAGNLPGSLSPPPMQMLSLSPNASPSLSPSSPWIPKDPLMSHRDQPPTYITMPPNGQNGFHNSLDYHAQPHGHPPSPYAPPSPYSHPPSSGHTPKSAKSAINPIFKVVSYKWDSVDGLVPDDSGDFVQPPLPPSTGNQLSPPNALPPFSQLEAVAGGEYPPPLSPMSFVTPTEDT
ncbi:kinase-like domain-containing protein [Crucibulum laeve]|uniref:Kinase-like domain-containing protein n=1 Tax=Crucibulum laeve TaxID=68775 RepID=A0A5C3M913_9AGAR|nr:kinase-like domain-containing protein [Crucibulum laeve]